MTKIFDTKLQQGLKVERMVLEDLIRKYKSATLIDKFKGYDIWIPEINAGVEVKYDRYSNQTGNILVEYEMNNVPSALMATTAKYWVFFDDKVLKWFRPRDIIKCIFDNKLTHKEFTSFGDTTAKKAFLIKKDMLFKYGRDSIDAYTCS